MTVTLTPELEAEIQQQLDSGRFHTPAEVLMTALGALRDEFPDETIETFNAKLQEAIDEVDRGETFSEEEARAHLAELRRALNDGRV
jgi:Arc/MetJ-type ribon-helix-helix transcriptional regulator